MELNVKELCNWGQSPIAPPIAPPISPDFFYVNHPKQILKILFNRQLCFSLQ